MKRGYQGKRAGQKQLFPNWCQLREYQGLSRDYVGVLSAERGPVSEAGSLTTRLSSGRRDSPGHKLSVAISPLPAQKQVTETPAPFPNSSGNGTAQKSVSSGPFPC